MFLDLWSRSGHHKAFFDIINLYQLNYKGRLFDMTFLNDFVVIVVVVVVRKEKIVKFGLNYHRYMVQPLDTRILRRSL